MKYTTPLTEKIGEYNTLSLITNIIQDAFQSTTIQEMVQTEETHAEHRQVVDSMLSDTGYFMDTMYEMLVDQETNIVDLCTMENLTILQKETINYFNTHFTEV